MGVHCECAVSSGSNVVDIFHRPKDDGGMQRLQAFKFELMPNGLQERQIRRFAGTCRFAFNKALALQKERHEQGEKKLSYADLCKLLTAWKQDEQTRWLAETPSQRLRAGLRQLLRQAGRFSSFQEEGSV